MRCRIRIVLSCPSELFDNVVNWNADHAKLHAQRIIWRTPSSLQRLVNKALRHEYNLFRENIPTLKPVTVSGVWEDLFPKEIYNRYSHQVNTFEYVLRHTQYNPRQLTAVVQQIVEDVERFVGVSFPLASLKLEKRPAFSVDWSNIVSVAVRNATDEICKDQINVLASVYEGLRDVLNHIYGHPSIWSRAKLIDHILQADLVMRKSAMSSTGVETEYRGEEIIYELQSMGILGLYKQESENVNVGHTFIGNFSFLHGQSYRGNYDIVCFSPMFHGHLGLWIPDFRLEVLTHGKLLVASKKYDWIKTYRPALKTGIYDGKDRGRT